MKCSHRILVFWTFSFFLELCALQLGKEHNLQPRQASSRADCNYSSFNNEKNKRNVYLFEIVLPGAAWENNCRKPDIELLLENIKDRCTRKWLNDGSQKYLNSIKSSAAGSKCHLEIIITTNPETDQSFPSFDDYDCMLRPEPQLDELSITEYDLPWPSMCHFTKSIEVSLHGKHFTAEEDKLLVEERGLGKPWSEIIESFPRRTWTSLAVRYRTITKGLSLSKSSHKDYNYNLYTPDEDQLLIEAKEADLSWKEITQLFEGRHSTSSLKKHHNLLIGDPPKTIASHEYSHFTPDEDKLLLEAKDAGFSWKEIEELFERGRTLRSLEGRYRLLRGPAGQNRFTPEEDELLVKSRENGMAWKEIAELFDGQRTLGSLRKRFRLLRGPAGRKKFTPEEDELLIRSKENGMAWKEIAELFKGQRTEGSLLRRYLRLGGSVPHEKFTPDEDKLLLEARANGMTWKDVAELFQGRRTADALGARYRYIVGKTV